MSDVPSQLSCQLCNQKPDADLDAHLYNNHYKSTLEHVLPIQAPYFCKVGCSRKGFRTFEESKNHFIKDHQCLLALYKYHVKNGIDPGRKTFYCSMCQDIATKTPYRDEMKLNHHMIHCHLGDLISVIMCTEVKEALNNFYCFWCNKKSFSVISYFEHFTKDHSLKCKEILDQNASIEKIKTLESILSRHCPECSFAGKDIKEMSTHCHMIHDGYFDRALEKVNIAKRIPKINQVSVDELKEILSTHNPLSPVKPAATLSATTSSVATTSVATTSAATTSAACKQEEIEIQNTTAPKSSLLNLKNYRKEKSPSAGRETKIADETLQKAYIDNLAGRSKKVYYKPNQAQTQFNERKLLPEDIMKIQNDVKKNQICTLCEKNLWEIADYTDKDKLKMARQHFYIHHFSLEIKMSILYSILTKSPSELSYATLNLKKCHTCNILAPGWTELALHFVEEHNRSLEIYWEKVAFGQLLEHPFIRLCKERKTQGTQAEETTANLKLSETKAYKEMRLYMDFGFLPDHTIMVQNRPCRLLTDNLPRCRDCKKAEEGKGNPDSVCQFEGFRKISKMTALHSEPSLLAFKCVGFLDEQKDSTNAENENWIPLLSNVHPGLDIPHANHVMKYCFGQFCTVAKEELKVRESYRGKVLYKPIQPKVREMCDVCSTSLFNYHWTCKDCCTSVCIDCYKTRRLESQVIYSGINSDESEDNTGLKKPHKSSRRLQDDIDSFYWPKCSTGALHDPELFALSEIIGKGHLKHLWEAAHKIVKTMGFKIWCPCQPEKPPLEYTKGQDPPKGLQFDVSSLSDCPVCAESFDSKATSFSKGQHLLSHLDLSDKLDAVMPVCPDCDVTFETDEHRKLHYCIDHDKFEELLLAEKNNQIQNNNHNAETVRNQNGDQSVMQNGDQSVNQNGDQSVNQNGDQSVNQNGDQSVKQNGDQSVKQNGDQSVNQNGDQSVSQNRDPSVNQNENQSVIQNGDPSVNQNGDPSLEENLDPNQDVRNVNLKVDSTTRCEICKMNYTPKMISCKEIRTHLFCEHFKDHFSSKLDNWVDQNSLRVNQRYVCIKCNFSTDSELKFKRQHMAVQHKLLDELYFKEGSVKPVRENVSKRSRALHGVGHDEPPFKRARQGCQRSLSAQVKKPLEELYVLVNDLFGESFNDLGKKVYRCLGPTCERETYEIGGMISHVIQHIKETFEILCLPTNKSLTCRACNQSCSDSLELVKHVILNHQRKKPFFRNGKPKKDLKRRKPGYSECELVKRQALKEAFFEKMNNLVKDVKLETDVVDHPEEKSELDERLHPPPHVSTYRTTTKLYPGVPHQWFCDGQILHLEDPTLPGNMGIFHDQWSRGQPVTIGNCNKHLDKRLWTSKGFLKDFGHLKHDLINCLTGEVIPNAPLDKFWKGFDTISERLIDKNGTPMLLKLKDWPPTADIAKYMPKRFQNLFDNFPLPEYTKRDGVLNLASHLPEIHLKPELGPKLYIAYGSALYADKASTNLHLDMSDAVNLLVYVSSPEDSNKRESAIEVLKQVDLADCDILVRLRVRDPDMLPGALWHVYLQDDTVKIRNFLNKVALENGKRLDPHEDPIHDQSTYLTTQHRMRLYKEYKVRGYAVLQFAGDTVFIPAGACHQVRNLNDCIKIAEDFVSPENISHCLKLTQEFRNLTEWHTNHEDKLQIKTIMYHAVKNAVAVLQQTL